MFRYIGLVPVVFATGCASTQDRFCSLIDKDSYFLVSVAGCDTVQVSFEYDKGTSFSVLDSYDWLPGQGSHDNKRLHDWVTNAVDAGLAQQGLNLDGKTPDFLVSYDAPEKTQGTLTLTFVLTDSRQPVWRGTADDRGYPARNTDALETRIRKAVELLLEQFPPNHVQW